MDGRSSLSVGQDISRPSSTHSSSTQASRYSQTRQFSQPSLKLPALSALASIASTAPEAQRSLSAGNGATFPPLALPANQGTSLPPLCQNCSTSTTPLWRRDENGSVLCNACGLFLKLHGRPRPISLKTDVIKSRNRVKATGQAPRGRKSNGTEQNGSLAASHPDVSVLPASAVDGYNPLTRRVSHKFASSRSSSPISRTDTPLTQPSNIAPQHVFDGVGFPHNAFDSPSLPSFSIRQPSPSAASINGLGLDAHGADGQSAIYEAGSPGNEALKTRVSELEVIQHIFRGRVEELEKSEQAARQREAALRKQLDDALEREQALKRTIEALEGAAAVPAQSSPERRSKRIKVADLSGA